MRILRPFTALFASQMSITVFLCLCFSCWGFFLSCFVSATAHNPPLHQVVPHPHDASSHSSSYYEQQPYEEQQPLQPLQHSPTINVNIKDMVLALRWTAEVNRQLQATSSAKVITTTAAAAASPSQRHPSLTPPSLEQPQEHLRGGGEMSTDDNDFWTDDNSIDASSCFRIPPSAARGGGGSAASIATDSSPLTVFHAKTPRPQKNRRGTARWGPELHTYLKHLQQTLSAIDSNNDNESNNSLLWTVAMMYLDRACSVETPRSNNNNNNTPKLPFVTPRTVHRLVLTAYILAVHVVYQRPLQDCYRAVSSLGIPTAQLQHMVEWMREACGDYGLVVTPIQLQEWKQTWERSFCSTTRQRDTSSLTPKEENTVMATTTTRHHHSSSSSYRSPSSWLHNNHHHHHHQYHPQQQQQQRLNMDDEDRRRQQQRQQGHYYYSDDSSSVEA